MSDRQPHPVRLFAALSARVPPPAPDRPARGGLTALADAAVTADRAGVDALVVRGSDPADPATVEPSAVLAVVAARTVALGLVAEASPEYHEPDRLARELATLDILSEGRAGLLLDPRADPAKTRTGLPPLPSHDEPGTARAEEFLTVLTGLWDGLDDDTLAHSGIARPPQGHPVLLTAWTPSAGTAADYHVSGEESGADVPRVKPVALPATPGASPEESADLLEVVILAEQPGALLLDFPAGPASLEVFARVTLPLLRERGVLPLPAERVARTLRRRLGLGRPADRTTAAR